MALSHSRSSRPALELLEARDCPAVSLNVFGSTLVVTGDDANNTVTITDDGNGNVTATGDGRTVNAGGINQIVVDTRCGNDTFRYTLTGALEGDRSLSVKLGRGTDNGTIDAQAGVARGTFAVNLDGEDDADTLSATLGSIAAGARADVRVEGDGGNDTINVAFSGELDGELRLRADGDDGDDTITGTVALAAGSTGRLDAEVRGGNGNDRLTLNVTGDTGALDSFEARIDGGDGTDTFTATANVRLREVEVRA
jgi:hypothetical protein